MAGRTKATVVKGQLTIHFASNAAKETLRSIVRLKRKPLSQASRTGSARFSYGADDEDGENDPNHRGTYSKQYTLEHPEIKFVHRGQGRYVRVPDIKDDAPITTPRSTRYVKFE
jgi:hypothetical protein